MCSMQEHLGVLLELKGRGWPDTEDCVSDPEASHRFCCNFSGTFAISSGVGGSICRLRSQCFASGLLIPGKAGKAR